MTDQEQHILEGQCLCGAVGIRARVAVLELAACHCMSCRTVTGGGPHFGLAAARAGVEISGEENVTVYRSSDWAERGFCRVCGTYLFYQMAGEATSPNVSLCPGLFGKTTFRVASEMFVEEKPDFYDVPGVDERTTGAEAKEMLATFLEKRRPAQGAKT